MEYRCGCVSFIKAKWPKANFPKWGVVGGGSRVPALWPGCSVDYVNMVPLYRDFQLGLNY